MNPADLLAAARSRGVMITTAESCTGGLLAGALTAVPGASDVFDRGFVTYSYPSKTDLLGVAPALLECHGAVSGPVAEAMAEGALHRAQAGLALAITGVAGPGGSEAKPEGLVWFGVATPGHVSSHEQHFGPRGRDQVRAASVAYALELGLARLKAQGGPAT